MKTTFNSNKILVEKGFNNLQQALYIILFTILSALFICDRSYLLAGTLEASADSKGGYFYAPAVSFQQVPDIPIYLTIEWDKTYGGIDFDDLSSAILTPDGGYLLAGNSTSNASGDKSEDNKSKGWYDDYWVVKIDEQGNKIWDKTIGGSRYDWLESAISTSDGGYLLAGTSYSSASGDKSENSKGATDYWVVKIDAQGNKVWDKTIGGSSEDRVSNVISTPDGGYLLAGYSSSNASGDKSENSKGKNLYEVDYWVVKIDGQGNKIWDKTLGGSSWDEPSSAIPTPDGGYLLAGGSYSDASGDKSENSKGGNDFWVVKIDGQGNKIWDKTIGGNGDDGISSVNLTPNGGYLLAGNSRSDASGDKSENSKGGNDYWVVEIDAQGNKVWDKTIGGNQEDGLSRITPTPDGGYLLAGSSWGNASGDKSEDSKGRDDFWIVKIDAQGNKIWDKTFGGNHSDLTPSIISTGAGSYMLAGRSDSQASGDKSENSRGDFDYWAVKFKEETTPVVRSLTLIDSKSDQGIREIKEGDIIYLAEINSTSFSIRANAVGAIDHVKLELQGPITHTQTDKAFPYALFGDYPTGDFKSKEWVPGKYTLTVTPFSKDEEGDALTITFEVTDAFAITGFTLIDAKGKRALGKLSEGDVIELASFSINLLNIQAETDPMRIGKVIFSLEGPITHTQTEEAFPYTLFGDLYFSGGGQVWHYFKGKEWVPGNYTLTATPYANGKKGDALTINFEVTDAFAITGFTHINAALDQDVGELSEGDVIDLASFNDHPLSIRADTDPMHIGKVIFALEGPITHTQTEKEFPYALFGDFPIGDFNGLRWSPGAYTLTATPFAFTSFAGTPYWSDSMGVSSTINFTVIDSRDSSPEAGSLRVEVFPVPTSDKINILYKGRAEESQLILLDFGGNVLLQQPLQQQPVEQINLSGFRKGIYYLKIVSPEKVQVFRVVKE